MIESVYKLASVLRMHRSKAAEEAEANVRIWERQRLLEILDDLWMQYLEELKELKSTVNIRYLHHIPTLIVVILNKVFLKS